MRDRNADVNAVFERGPALAWQGPRTRRTHTDVAAAAVDRQTPALRGVTSERGEI